MHTESAYDGCTAYCYPEQGMVDRLLRVHIQSQWAFGPSWTLSYNSISLINHLDSSRSHALSCLNTWCKHAYPQLDPLVYHRCTFCIFMHPA